MLPRPDLRLDLGRAFRAAVWRATVLGVVLTLLAACTGGASSSARTDVDDDALRVVTSTTVLADLVAEVGGARVDVRSLVPLGGEVHTFDPSPGDVAAVADADLIVLNGLGLDAWAEDLIDGAGSDARVVALGDDLDGVEYLTGEAHGEDEHGEDEHGEGEEAHDDEAVNPHLWLDVGNARRYAERIRDTLAELDPTHADEIRARARAYDARLAELDTSIRDRMAAIPEDRRRIVSFHEAFPYFAAAYGLEIVGVVVGAPGQDPSAGEINALVEAIRASGATAVFSEAQFDDRLARTVADEAGVKVESQLHNDSLGEPPADSYIGMMEANTDRIEAALE